MVWRRASGELVQEGMCWEIDVLVARAGAGEGGDGAERGAEGRKSEVLEVLYDALRNP